MHIPDGAEVLRVKVFPEASEDLVVKKWMEGKTGHWILGLILGNRDTRILRILGYILFYG
jgi:hypothetical protein